MFSRAFGVEKAAASLTVSAPGIAVALGAPFAGWFGDRFGRRNVIIGALFLLAVPTLLAATSRSLGELVTWRFLQGLAVPGVYAVSVAYAGATWEGGGVGRAMAAIVTGNVLGGFLGRTVCAVVAERAGWRGAFVALAALTVTGAILTARWLPRDARARVLARPSTREGAGERGLLPRSVLGLRGAPLVATFAVGSALLFTQVAIFTYVTFHLSAPPFHLGPTALGAIFVVYLAGAAVTPRAGRWIDRVGPRVAMAGSAAMGIAGAALTLAPALPLVVVGLALGCTAVFVGQSAATTHLSRAAPPQLRSVASGVYISCYYVGGAVGGILPSAAWRLGGWAGCVALVAVVQVAMIALVLAFWTRERPVAAPAAVAVRAA
jgi:predicted MFS family arabinose efflux permease